MCPHCGRATTITHSKFELDDREFNNGNVLGSLNLISRVVICPSPDCKKFEVKAELVQKGLPLDPRNSRSGWKQIQHWDLLPSSSAKQFPEFVPAAILEDYGEACKIQTLSPKASATLSRRCLQGMIRDFWKIKKDRLVDEINELNGRIDPLTWDGIDAVRKIGNIGAHMEKDINVIVEVDPNEAALMIGLVEMLIEDWYIAKHNRKERLSALKSVA
ncbi:MAG: DUF4145 domain-containing protein, partial [Planctomycetes bacterium]|nr:DUF4145 domain-containing protein [Planctomycetota bacterium]